MIYLQNMDPIWPAYFPFKIPLSVSHRLPMLLLFIISIISVRLFAVCHASIWGFPWNYNVCPVYPACPLASNNREFMVKIYSLSTIANNYMVFFSLVSFILYVGEMEVHKPDTSTEHTEGPTRTPLVRPNSSSAQKKHWREDKWCKHFYRICMLVMRGYPANWPGRWT